jgi:hypothetical protein
MKRSPNSIRFFALALGLLCLGLLGCGSSGSLTVIKPLPTPFRAKSITVVGEGNGIALEKGAHRLKDMLVARLEKQHTFAQVGPDGDLVLRAKIQNMDDGREIKRSLSLTGRARATVEVRIAEPSGKLVGHLNVEAASERSGGDDHPEERVLAEIADRIAAYLAESTGKASKK